MKASLDSIPNEILAIIEPELHLEDVASLVLSCRSLNAALTPLLYRRGSGHLEVTLWAAARGEVGVLEKLFDAGADLDKKSIWEETFDNPRPKPDLYHSITVDALQDSDTPDAVFSLQHTLHTTSYSYYDEGDEGADDLFSSSRFSGREVVIECQPETLTALTLAAKLGHEHVIDFLLQHDASINQRCRQSCYCEDVVSATFRFSDSDPRFDHSCEYEWTPLHLAIYHGHLSSAKKLMTSGASFEACQSEHSIPRMANALDIASAAGDTAMFAAVQEHFASTINEWHMRNALDFAYMHRSMDIFHILLDHGIGIEDPATHSFGTTILMEACASDGFTDAFWLLELGANASQMTELNMTPLNCLGRTLDRVMKRRRPDEYTHMPLRLKNDLADLRDTMELLLRNGADPNICVQADRGPAYRLPLVAAAEWCQVDMITLLLDYDADIDAYDQYDYSPLWAASLSRIPAQDLVATMTLLIERGAFVPIVGNSNGNTILDNITQKRAGAGDLSPLVSLLLDCGLTPEAGLRGDTWIMDFFRCGQFECCKLLAKHGTPDPSFEDLTRMLQYAIETNNAEAMRYVLGLKDMVNQPISKSDLYKAFECRAEQVVPILLQHGAPWTHISRDEWTRLLLAYDFVITRYLRIHTLLLERGADPNTMLQHKWTPLQQAIWFDNLPLVQVLLEHGADPDLKAMDDSSPMELAHQLKSFHTLKLLLEYSGVKGKVRRRWKSRIYNGLAKLKKGGGPSTDAS